MTNSVTASTLVTVAALLFALNVSCRGASKRHVDSDPATAAATAAAKSWVEIVDQGQYAESWDAAGELLRAAVDREKWSEVVGAARRPLGAVTSRNLKSAEYKTSLPGAPDGKYVVVEFETSFENKKEAVETVTPGVAPDGSWRVLGYIVR